ncbi:MAG TPA: hypothetical protein PLK34_00495 [Candidatus Pacearchaeota archaeon]|nr:hypothetical protein [Candidatus Pacearchaeota archaeon]
MNKLILKFSLGISIILLSFLIFIAFFQSSDDLGSSGYYQDLLKRCELNGEYDPCCLSSWERMEKRGYLLAPETGCPLGYIPNMLKCFSSFRWCEPII